MEPIERSQVIDFLANAAFRGRLGLFVGTGFSKAATKGVAPTFEELLQSVAETLRLESDFKAEIFHLKSLPQIATTLIAALADQRGMSSEQAGVLFRQEIANRCNLIPEKESGERLEAALGKAKPSWIVTTNYDLILESLIERSETVLPSEALFPNQEHVPIYHLHGHRHYLDSIKVTEEDYVGLLAPLDYQRLKLPLLFAESTTMMLGYALGDINVRAAIEWSKSFQSEARRPGSDLHGQVVQALYKKDPDGNPSFGDHGEIILEVEDVAALLDEIGSARHEIERKFQELEAEIQEFLSDGKNALAIDKDGPERARILKIVGSSSEIGSTGAVLQFLDKAMAPIWDKAREDGGFDYYDAYLEILIFLMGNLKRTETSPNMIFFIARTLNRVGHYFDEKFHYGTAHQATRRWLKEAPGLNGELLEEFRSLSQSHDLGGLDKLMKCSVLKR